MPSPPSERPIPALCRGCGGDGLSLLLSLGPMPLANALLSAEDLARPEPRYPLDLAVCPRCALVQITEAVPPDVLFREYLYFSSVSSTMVEHARALVSRMISARRLGPQSLVVEVASNDGYLLQFYRAAGIGVLGIEPALNVADVAERERGIPTLREFFGVEVAEALRETGHRADVIHAHNVLAHVPDPNLLLAGMRTLLKPEGVAVVEVPYLKDLLDRLEFDTIYHEHHCYFSLTALDRLARRQDLHIVDVDRLPIHGGSLRLTLARADGREGAAPSVEALLAEERAWGAEEAASYRQFARRVEALRSELQALIRSLKQRGERLAGYGAAAKASVLLNYVGIGPGVLDFVVDRSPYKQGRFVPGVRVPIVAPDALLARRPDCVLLLAWNLAEEVLDQQAEYRRGGGRFLIPVPTPRMV